MVVLLKSKVQLSATDRTSGVLADEKRRVAARRFAAARNPPTGEIAESTGRSNSAAMRATIGPRKPTAATRKRAFISDVAAAVCGLCVTAETENSAAVVDLEGGKFRALDGIRRATRGRGLQHA